MLCMIYNKARCLLQIHKDPDVRLEALFVVGDEMPKVVCSHTASTIDSSTI